MTDLGKAGTFALGTRTVKRIGYGAMQLAGRAISPRKAVVGEDAATQRGGATMRLFARSRSGSL